MNTPTETDVKSNLKNALQELSAILAELKNKRAEIEKHETLAKSGREQLASFAREGALDDIQIVGRYNPLDLQTRLADDRVQQITEQLPAIEEKLSGQNKTATKSIQVALRTTKTCYVEKAAEDLRSHFNTIEEAREHADGSASVVQTKKRIADFDFMVRGGGYGPPELADELIAWGNGVLTELKQLEKSSQSAARAAMK